MAITRTQQARQMLKKGSKPVEQAGVMNYMPSEMVTVPKIAKSSPDTPTAKLAYITPKEQDILIDLNLYGSLDGKPNRGPGGIPSLEGDFGSPTGQADKGGSYDRSGADNDVSGRRDTGTGDYQKSDRPDDVAARKEYEKNRKQREKDSKAVEEKFKKDARKTRKRMRDLKQKDLVARQQRIKDILAGKIDYLTPTQRADLEALGLDPAFEGPMTPEQQIAFDNLIEKSDQLSGVNLETFQNRFDVPQTGITSLDLVLNALKGPLKAGAKKNREFFSDPDYMGLFGKKKPSVLEAGKFTYEGLPIDPTVFGRLGPAEMEEIYGNYMDKRMGGEIDAYGNPIIQRDDSGPSDPCLGPNPPAYCFIGQRAATPPEDPIFTPAFRFMNRGGMVEDAPMGGIMDLETTRQMLFIGGVAKAIGKGVKSVTRGLKKVAKSPLGKAALLGAVSFGIPGTKFGGLFGDKFANMTLPKLITDNMSGLKIAAMSGLGGALLASLENKDDDDFDIEEYYRTAGIDIPQNQYRFLAEGGSTEKEPVAKKTMPLLDLEGQEMDFRQDGGFVPIGRMEKADDVPARLSKNEFVFTAEAVRNAGGGDVDKGAEVMYNTMKNLEAGGEVSEETQGLEGARKMFQTSQRLGEVV